MKRFLNYCLIIVLIINTFSFVVTANDSKIVVKSKIEDTTVTISVSIENNPGFIAFSLNTEFDKNVITPVSITDGALLTNGGDTITSNISSNTYTADFVSAVWASLKPINSDGELFTINFKLNDECVTDKVSVKVVCNEFLSDKKEFLELSPVIHTITLQSGNKPILRPTIELKKAADTIRYMNDYGNQFKPLQYATRYEITDALYNLFEFKNINKDLKFSDVSNDYKNKVAAFASVGVINGYNDGTFGGEKNITRAEFVKLLTTAFKFTDQATQNTFFNDTENHWAKNYINAFATMGYAKGYENTDGTFSFKPDKFVSRSEAVVFINRIINASGKTSDKKYTDLSADYWAYNEIMKVID